MLRLAVLALSILMPVSAALAQPAAGPVLHLKIGTLDRSYLLDHFHADQTKGQLPIVIFLHGLGTLITEGVPERYDIPFAAEPGMDPALIVRPQGVDRRWDAKPGRIRTWTRLAGTDGEPVDDIAFLRALIDHLVADENGDPARVYVAGVSSGGYLVPRIAYEMGEKVAAVADVIATSVRSVFEDCNPHPVAPLPHAATEHDSTVSVTRFSDCNGDADVLFYRVDGSSHSVPSTTPIGAAGWAASGRRNRDMETARVLWDFFKAHQLPTAPATL